MSAHPDPQRDGGSGADGRGRLRVRGGGCWPAQQGSGDRDPWRRRRDLCGVTGRPGGYPATRWHASTRPVQGTPSTASLPPSWPRCATRGGPALGDGRGGPRRRQSGCPSRSTDARRDRRRRLRAHPPGSRCPSTPGGLTVDRARLRGRSPIALTRPVAGSRLAAETVAQTVAHRSAGRRCLPELPRGTHRGHKGGSGT